MIRKILISGLVTFIYCQNAWSKVELYQPTILQSTSDGFVRVSFSGQTTPNTKVAINTDSSIVIKNVFPLKYTQLPASLSTFTKSYLDNLSSKKEGIMRIKSGCPLYSRSNAKSKIIKTLPKVTLARGIEFKKNWIQIGSKDYVYVQPSCIVKPRLDARMAKAPSDVSDENGQFNLIAHLPEGDIQLLFLVEGDKASSHLFTFDVSSLRVSSPTPFAPKPVAKKVAEPKNIEPASPTSEPSNKWRFDALLGVGFNYHSLDQKINEAEDINFKNSKMPTLGFEISGARGQWGFFVEHNAFSAKLKKANPPYTLASSEYNFSNTQIGGLYSFSSELANSYYLLASFQHRKMPFLLVDVTNAVDINDVAYNSVKAGFGYLSAAEAGFNPLWNIQLSAPLSTSGPGDVEIKGQMGASVTAGVLTQWRADIYTVGQGTIEYFTSKYDYDLAGFQRSGSQSLMNTQIELKIGYRF